MSKLVPPCHVLAVGKVRSYHSQETDQIYVSVQPEVIKPVSEDSYNRWIMESCDSLRTRLEGYKELRQLEEPTHEKLTKLGCEPRVAEGLMLTHEFYDDAIDIGSYAGLLYDGLTKVLPKGTEMPGRPTAAMPPPGPASSNSSGSAALAVEQAQESAANFTTGNEMLESKATKPGGPGSVPDSALVSPEASLTAAPAPTSALGDEGLANEAGEIDREAVVTALIGKLDQDAEGAMWELLAEAAQKKGIDSVELDETLNSLRDQGLIYEPTFGRFKLS